MNRGCPHEIKKEPHTEAPNELYRLSKLDSLEPNQAVVNIDGTDAESDEHADGNAAGQDTAHDARSNGDQSKLVVDVVSVTQNLLLLLKLLKTHPGQIAQLATEAGPIIEHATIQRTEILSYDFEEPLEMVVGSRQEPMHHDLRCLGFHELSNLQCGLIPTVHFTDDVRICR